MALPDLKNLKTLREAGIYIATLEERIGWLADEVKSIKNLTTGTLVTVVLGVLYLVAQKALEG